MDKDFYKILPPRKGVSFDFKEMWDYRELLYFFIWKDIKVRYKQTAVGALWAVIQPFFTMIVFSLFFGILAKIPSDGLPYPLFYYSALLPWTFFANALLEGWRTKSSFRSNNSGSIFPTSLTSSSENL